MYPNEWSGLAQGINEGVGNAAKIIGIQQAQEDQAMKRDLAQKTAAEYEYDNKPVTTVGKLIEQIPDLDPAGRAAVAKLASSYGYNPEDAVSRKHLERISNLVTTNPIIADTVVGHKERYLKDQIAGAPDEATKAAFQEKLDRLKFSTKQAQDATKAQSEMMKAEAAKDVAAGKGQAKTWEQIYADPNSTAEDIARADKIVAKKKELATKEHADPFARMDYAEAKRAAREEKKAAEKAIADKSKELDDRYKNVRETLRGMEKNKDLSDGFRAAARTALGNLPAMKGNEQALAEMEDYVSDPSMANPKAKGRKEFDPDVPTSRTVKTSPGVIKMVRDSTGRLVREN